MVIVSDRKEWILYNGLIGIQELWSYHTQKKDEIEMIKKLQDKRNCYFKGFVNDYGENEVVSLLEGLLFANLLFVNEGDELEYEELLSNKK